mgnify:CR=1 FL=1
MAQIIQHKRGVLEDLGGVTANKGELLVVTGSSISALSDGLVFVGNHSDLTSVNKILTGSSSPNMAAYDVGVNGLPFYNTSDKKLQILRNDGNLDVILSKDGLDLDGTGIVSSSAQVSALAGINDSTLTLTAGSNLSGGGTFTTNQSGDSTVSFALDLDGSNVVSGSQQILDLVSIDEDAMGSNSATKVPTQQSVVAYVASQIETKDNSDEITEGSTNLYFTNARADARITNAILDEDNMASDSATQIPSQQSVKAYVDSQVAGKDALSELSGDTDDVSEGSSNLYYTDARVKLKLDADTVISGSSQVDYDSISNQPTTISSAQATKLSNISITQAVNLDTMESNIATNNSKVGYTDALVKLKLDADTVISGSSQVNADSITNFDLNVRDFVRSIDVISGSSQVTGITNTQISGVNHSKIDFDGSGLTSGSLGLVVGDGSATDTVNVGVDTLAIVGTANEVTTAVTNNQVQIGLPDNVTVGGNMVISGNLTVSGDTVQTNTTTLNVEDNIINVNYGGSETDGGLYVSDVTGGGLTSGSILWDGTNDYWKAGAKDSEARVIVGNGTDTAGKITKFSADGVITDSIISESGTTVTISNDLILSGLTASSFLVSNGSKQLVSIASSTDGDFLVSNGSGTYSATNTIDGGTF